MRSALARRPARIPYATRFAWRRGFAALHREYCFRRPQIGCESCRHLSLRTIEHAGRQADEKRRAFAAPHFKSQRAAVLVDDDGARDREPLSRTLADFFCRIKRVEYTVARRFRYPRAGVADRDFNGIPVESGAYRENSEFAGVFDDIGHRMRGVDDQVEDYLIDLAQMARNQRQLAKTRIDR